MSAARDLKPGDGFTLCVDLEIVDVTPTEDGKRITVRAMPFDPGTIEFAGDRVVEFQCRPGRRFALARNASVDTDLSELSVTP